MSTLLDPTSFDTIEKQLAERGAALAVKYDHVEKRIADVVEAHEARLAAQLSGASETNERTLIKQIAARSLAREKSAAKREAIEASDEQRRAIMSVVEKYEADVETTAGLFQSPVQVLARTAIGTPERGNYLAQLQGAGPAELQSAADLALATNDRALASAVAVTADRDTKKYSQFDRPAFAQKVVGEEVAAVQKRIADLRVKIQAMKALDRAFVRSGSGELSANDKIEIGVAKQRLTS